MWRRVKENFHSNGDHDDPVVPDYLRTNIDLNILVCLLEHASYIFLLRNIPIHNIMMMEKRASFNLWNVRSDRYLHRRVKLSSGKL